MKMVEEKDTVRAQGAVGNYKDTIAGVHTPSVSSISVADRVCIVLNHPLTKKTQWEVILDHNRHEEILGKGTHEVNAWGEDGTNAPVFWRSLGWGGLSQSYFSPECSVWMPRRYTGMPLVS